MAQGIRHVGRERAIAELDVELDAGGRAARQRQRPARRGDDVGGGVDHEGFDVDAVGVARGIEHPRRDHAAQRPDARIEPAVRRPRIQHEAPALHQQRAPRQRLDMAARGRDQRRDDGVIIAMLDAQESFRLRHRPRFGGWRDQKDGGHGCFLLRSPDAAQRAALRRRGA